MTSRIVAAIAFCVLAAALGLTTWLATPWHTTVRASDAAAATRRDFTPQERERSGRFHRELRPWSYGSLAIGLIASLILGLTPAGAWLVELVARPLGGGWGWRASLGGLLLGLLGQLLTLPFSARVEVLSRRYGLSTRSWGGWWLDLAKAWLIAAVLTAAILLGFYALVRATPRWWWSWTALGGAALVFALSFAYPIVIEPIFNRFTPMGHTALRHDLMAMAANDGVPVREVLVADASKRTTALNAYVSGFGASRRIVVYDTLLKSAPPEEVKLVVAHELGHAKRNDVLVGTALAALGAAAASCLAYLVFSWRPLLRLAGVDELADPRSVGLLLAVVALAAFLTLPLQNAVSRRIEARADQHSLHLTHDPDGFVRMQRRLALSNLSDLAPNPIAQFWFGSHPTTSERLAMAREFARHSEGHDR